jgi:hypothetical protein
MQGVQELQEFRRKGPQSTLNAKKRYTLAKDLELAFLWRA